MRFLAFLLVCFAILPSASLAQDEPLDISAILEAQAAYDANQTNKTRAGLLNALETYKGEPTVETVNAHLIVMMNDTMAGNHRKMRDSALLATTHLEPVSDILPKQFAEAKFLAAVALFNDQFESSAIIEMAHVEGFARSMAGDSENPPDWVDPLGWKATAWVYAMQAYFESVGERYPKTTEIDEILASYGFDLDEANEEARLTAGESGLPHCPGELIQRPKMKYPAGGARRGRFGAVILGFEFDRQGQVINPEVLASVPLEFFNAKSKRTVGKWRYKPDNEADVGVTCALERTNVVLPIVFQIR